MTRNRRDTAPEGAADGQVPGGEGPRAALDDAQVAAYLRRHPDFLVANPALLDALDVPARPGLNGRDGVVDLQRAMVERLRGELESLRRERDGLVATGRSNRAAQQRVNKAVLALLAARSFEHLIETATTDLAVILDLDAVCLCVEKSHDTLPPTRINGVHHLPPGFVGALFGPGRRVLLCADIVGEPAIFGPAAALVRSQGLLRLSVSEATPPALLALGARQPEHFEDGQGTDLLAFLAQALERVIRAWLELPE